MKEDVKHKGQVYTPISIVNMMLDYAGYVPSKQILWKHVMDNSCGDGRILGEVVKRYIQASRDYGDGDLRVQLGKYIHGIEYDYDTRNECIAYLDSILKENGIESIIWDIKWGNSLDLKLNDRYLYQMDFVFGNPPYVRMKNIKKSDETNEDYQILKKYSFAEKGMSDLYLAFYQLGISMCKDGEGVMCYIAPSAWINSQSGDMMRKFIKKTKWLSSVIDFEHIQVFDNATTYVMITLFDMKPHQFVRYDKYDEEKKDFYPVLKIPYDRLFIDDKMYFVSQDEYDFINNVNGEHPKRVEVKNGYATLADDVFIDDFPGFEKYTIPVLKASTLKWKYCLFPYDENLDLVSLEKIKETSPEVYNYLVEHAETLQKRTYDTKMINDTWHSIGRSQGLKDTFVKKLSLNTLVKDKNDIKMNIVPAGSGVYSGLYIPIVDDIPPGEIAKLLRSDEFINYVKSLRKYKSGGYYTFSSKDVERYLNYMIEGLGL